MEAPFCGKFLHIIFANVGGSDLRLHSWLVVGFYTVWRKSNLLDIVQ